jgi:hypothetical protein
VAGLQEPREGSRTTEVMSQGPASAGRLSESERRALGSFLAGRLPAGQLHGELCRAREAALAAAAAHEGSAEAPRLPPDGAPAAPAPSLRVA